MFYIFNVIKVQLVTMFPISD